MRKLKPVLWILGVPTLYALTLRFIFGLDTVHDIFDVMSVSFLFVSPFIIGALTIYFSPLEKVENFRYRFFTPWIPIFIFFIITVLISWEGLACWIMVLPLFLIASSIGGLIGGVFKFYKRDNNLYVSLLTLLPLLIAPFEKIHTVNPQLFEAYTYIDIKATPEKIWGNVTRVREIQKSQDKGYLTTFLGFPRPVKAELNYLGVGAFRKAIFTNGLVFTERVTEYVNNHKMSFTISANPSEIPAVAMDEHVVIGGDYFDVLNGTYELEEINSSTYRLHLTSHFTLKTNFNFYAGWWATQIMKDIQANILKIEKLRSEAE